MTKVNEYFSITNGIFSHMTYDFEIATKEQLDILFFTNYGEKNVAPLVTKTLSEIPTTEELNLLGSILVSLFSVKWSKLKALCTIEYDPIHNYKDQLVENIDIVGASTDVENNSYVDVKVSTGSNNQTRTDNLDSTQTKSNTTIIDSTVDDGVYGYNSSALSDTDKSTNHETDVLTGTNTTTNTGTQKNDTSLTDNTTISKTDTISKESNTTNGKVRTSTHSGNIGNLTTQQLMNQEIELWKWNFINTVLDDLKDYLTIPIYLAS